MNAGKASQVSGGRASRPARPPPASVSTSHGPVRSAARAIASAALAARHGRTAEHSDEVVELCGVIAGELALGAHEREQLLIAAELHDVGKLAISREVLDKPGPLDADEWAIMRGHTIAGQHILDAVPEMADIGLIVRSAHERWDGDGYPDGISGEDIPLASRIIFCADAFHVIRSDRPYRAARPLDEALREIGANSGTQFDPRVAGALLAVADRVGHGRRRSRRGMSPRAMLLLMALAVAGTASAAIPASRHVLESLVGIHHAAPVSAPVVRAVPAPTPSPAVPRRVVPGPVVPRRVVPARRRAAAPARAVHRAPKAVRVHARHVHRPKPVRQHSNRGHRVHPNNGHHGHGKP